MLVAAAGKVEPPLFLIITYTLFVRYKAQLSLLWLRFSSNRKLLRLSGDFSLVFIKRGMTRRGVRGERTEDSNGEGGGRESGGGGECEIG